MKKYVGIIKLMINGEPKLLTRFSDDLHYIERWRQLYPNEAFMVIFNEEGLDEFFKDFIDLVPVTEKEHEALARAQERQSNQCFIG